ncbi:MAG: hypothetical protein M1837_006821 [Sclerophora amabilis]|nr:MAG: hypothetical protein M1837_006821 [Sclerophora amabilis]
MAVEPFHNPVLDGALQRMRQHNTAEGPARRGRAARTGPRGKKLAAKRDNNSKAGSSFDINTASKSQIKEIEVERRKIRAAAIKQVKKLAAIHDPSGANDGASTIETASEGRPKSSQADKLVEQVDGQANLPRVTPPRNVPDNMVNPERMRMINQGPQGGNGVREHQSQSTTGERKHEASIPQQAFPKPIIPDGISLPDGEENFSTPAARKEFWLKQSEGKAERRAARDVKRKAYRNVKQEWKRPKEIERRHKKLLEAVVEEETRRIASQISLYQRKEAMDVCAAMGFTLDNTEGAESIMPKVKGGKRRDPEDRKSQHTLQRAIDAAQIKKEKLVRQKAIRFCQSNEIQPFPELLTPQKPVKMKGRVVKEDGTLQTDKEARAKMKWEQTEKKQASKALRKYAKRVAEEERRRHWQMAGEIPKRSGAAVGRAKHLAKHVDQDVKMKDGSAQNESGSI